MEEQRKYAILLCSNNLAARKLNEIGVKPCSAQECAIADAIENAKRIRLTSAGLRNAPGLSISLVMTPKFP